MCSAATIMFFSNRLKHYLCIAGLLSASLCGNAALAKEIPDPYTIMKQVNNTIAAITDYTCVFSKHERVQNRIYKEDEIIMKVKRPGHFYMKWTKGANNGRVAIYVEGKNNNKLLLHLNGVLGILPVAIDPNGKQALKENRHAITEADFISIYERFAANCGRCLMDNECIPVVSSLKDTDTLELKVEFPAGKGYYAHRAAMTINRHSWLPESLICHGWDNEFLEEYIFDHIKINPGLAECDFEKE
jgi:hypothetical protein